MPDMQRLNMNKERIISTINLKGPSFPTRISRDVNISPLFVSALLAELVSEKKLKLSNMKVGSSPIYLLPGQEQQLESFSEYLNTREKEAFNILKENEILEDQAQIPPIRVALRAIKDFGIPVTVKINGETRLFWKFFLISNDTAKEKIQELIQEKKPFPKKEIKEKPVDEFSQQAAVEEPITKTNALKPKQEHEFPKLIQSYLTSKDIEILEAISSKKKEFISKIRTDIQFGKQEYYLISKDKKRITSSDLTIAIQTAQSEKMPAFFLSPGELDKKAKEYLQLWRNLIKFERVKF